MMLFSPLFFLLATAERPRELGLVSICLTLVRGSFGAEGSEFFSFYYGFAPDYSDIITKAPFVLCDNFDLDN
jgi:hypothetical protein